MMLTSATFVELPSQFVYGDGCFLPLAETGESSTESLHMIRSISLDGLQRIGQAKHIQNGRPAV